MRKPVGKSRYHHGDLRDALLQAAERVLLREGVDGLTLREVAREAGVSHAAPKNHFDNLGGLLSDLAAIGYERFRDEMISRVSTDGDVMQSLNAIGLGYVAFAEANPEMFLLMFRSERLDYERPVLRAASMAAFAVLSGRVGDVRQEELGDASMTLEQVAAAAQSWSLVHGYAMLLIDGRLQKLLARAPAGTDAAALLRAVLGVEPEVQD